MTFKFRSQAEAQTEVGSKTMQRVPRGRFGPIAAPRRPLVLRNLFVFRDSPSRRRYILQDSSQLHRALIPLVRRDPRQQLPLPCVRRLPQPDPALGPGRAHDGARQVPLDLHATDGPAPRALLGAQLGLELAGPLAALAALALERGGLEPPHARLAVARARGEELVRAAAGGGPGEGRGGGSVRDGGRIERGVLSQGRVGVVGRAGRGEDEEVVPGGMSREVEQLKPA